MRHSYKLAILVALTASILFSGCNLEASGMRDQTRDVSLYWSTPLERVNGEPMARDDIQGYEIRYRHKSESSFRKVALQGSTQDSYHFGAIKDPENYIFRVAVIDQQGHYSDFVTARP